MKGKLLALVLTTFFLSMVLVSAVDSQFFYKQGTSVDLKRPCYNNGTYCSSGTVCNMTIYYANDSIFSGINKAKMTNQNSFYNYTLPDTQILGQYRAEMVCNDGGVNGQETFWFSITPSGDDRGISWFLIIGLGAVLIFIIGIWIKNGYLGLISGIMFLVFGVYVLTNGFNNANDLFTQSLGYVSIGWGILTFVAGAYEVSTDDSIGGELE